MDESGGLRIRKEVGDAGEEGFAFDVPGGSQASSGSGEGCVLVAGMGDELPDPGGWKGFEELDKPFVVELAGCGDGEAAIRSLYGWGAFEGGREASLEDAVEKAHLGAAHGRAMTEAEGGGGLKGIAYGWDMSLLTDHE